MEIQKNQTETTKKMQKKTVWISLNQFEQKQVKTY